jgi:hypothetical protein
MPIAHGADNRPGSGLANARQLHELLGGGALARHQLNVTVVLRNALIEPGHLAQQITDHGVGPAGQIFQASHGLAAHDSGFERQHDAQRRLLYRSCRACLRGGR